MRNLDNDGLILCDLQAKTFEMSVDKTNTSSEVFIRRYMNSDVVKLMDNEGILNTSIRPAEMIVLIEEQFGLSDYGSVKYSYNEMYWIGYFYRYFAYTYEYTSPQVYKIVKPKELRGLFMAYHTLDTAQAIERVLEARGIYGEEDIINKQYEIFKQVRGTGNK